METLDRARDSSSSLLGKAVIEHCSNRFVIVEDCFLRKLWDIILAFLLLYTALVFPYRLCFIDYKQPPGSVEKLASWLAIETTVDYLFYIDLVVYFFFTYRDRERNEVTNWCSIVRNYLRTYFIINLIACIPHGVWEDVVGLLSEQAGSENGRVAKTTRVLRLQRASRLIRLMRLFRLAKLRSFVETNLFWRWLQDTVRGVRLFNFFVALFMIVHSLACGWYLVVSFEIDANSSWLARRVVGPNGETLLSRPGPEQWLHACYFILTVFTTVGFGDMSALTMIEISYVILVMLVGAIAHSIVVSEMINIVTSVDECEKAVLTKKALISAYAKRTDLDKSVLRRFESWLDKPRKGEVDVDRGAMLELFTSGSIPRELYDELPTNIYKGKLLQNRFWRLYHFGIRRIPPRFTVILSLMLKRRSFLAGDTVYRRHDHPFNIFLVISGIFANVAIATPSGGVDEFVDDEVNPRHAPKLQYSKTRGINALTMGLNKVLSAKHAKVNEGAKLTPYQIYAWGSYFGDMEIFGNRTINKCRYSTVSCMEAGLTLALGKKDVGDFIAEFPDAQAIWRAAARRREIAHQAFLVKHTRPMTHRDVAASTIQEWIRSIMGNDRRARDKSPSSVGPAVPQQSGVPVVGDQDRIRQLCDKVSSLHDNVHNLRSELRQDVEGLRYEVLTEMRAAFAEMRGAGNARTASVADTTRSRLPL